MRVLRNMISSKGPIGELLNFLWQRKLWWMIPFVITLLLIAGLLLAGQSSGAAPFVYTLF